MELQQTIDKLRENIEQLQRLYKLKRLRRILKFVLIGFLIGRDSEKRISELEKRNEFIIQRITSHIEELDAQILDLHQRIKEFTDVYTYLRSLGEKVKEFEENFQHAKTLIRQVEEGLKKHREMLLEYLKSAIEQKLSSLNKQVEEIENSGTYLIYSDKHECIEEIDSFERDLVYCIKNEILPSDFITKMKETLKQLPDRILSYNDEFIAQRKIEHSNLWQKGLLALDDEQQTAIVTDDKHNLVVAAAGSGKTEVLITRIAYLIARKPDGVKPNRILAIAYQKKDVKQIEQRLSRQYGITGVNVKTYHKLGIDILVAVNKMRSILDKDKRPKLIKRIYKEKLQSDSDFYEKFLQYVKSLHDSKVEVKESDKKAFLASKLAQTHTAIDDTVVKSRGEKEIMDFFLTTKLNGSLIQAEYEPEVEVLGKPDFHLPKYDLYVEHWGLKEDGEVPEWFDKTTEEYKENMERKKKWFAENNKLLVEMFSYEYDEDHPETFLQLLQNRVLEKLRLRYDSDFQFKPMSYKELLGVVCESYKDRISENRVSDDIFNFIKNAKVYNLSPNRIAGKLRTGRWSRKQRTFGNLAAKVYEEYERKLKELQKIDFEDMINDAIAVLRNDRELYADIFDHILVDEYQDISQQRYRLTKNLLNHNPRCKVFCVGDDWQSIMGFAGSNLEFFVNFEKYFDHPAITKISTNYRSVKTIVDAGACLIDNNRDCQISKKTISNLAEGGPIRVLRSPHQLGYRKRYYKQIASDCLNRIRHYLRRGYLPKDILVLSRFMHIHTHQMPRLHYVIDSLRKEAEQKGVKIAINNPKTSRKVRLLTVHKSKGLEARAVFLLNVIKGTYGFPCEIEDSAILEPARENYPQQDHKEEERRLFYVAMTRAKEDLHIYTWEPAVSEFLDEIEEYTDELRLTY